MSISIACACGKTVRCNDRLAGKKVKCPNPGCGRVLAVPAASSPPAGESVEDDAFALLNEGATPRHAPPRTKASPETLKKTVAESKAEGQHTPKSVFTFALVAVVLSILISAYLLTTTEYVILRIVGFLLLPAVALGLLIGIPLRRARDRRFEALIARGDRASIKELLALAFPKGDGEIFAQATSVIVQDLLKRDPRVPAPLVEALLSDEVEILRAKQALELAGPAGVERVVAALKHELLGTRRRAADLLKLVGWEPASAEQRERLASVEEEVALVRKAERETHQTGSKRVKRIVVFKAGGKPDDERGYLQQIVEAIGAAGQLEGAKIECVRADQLNEFFVSGYAYESRFDWTACSTTPFTDRDGGRGLVLKVLG